MCQSLVRWVIICISFFQKEWPNRQNLIRASFLFGFLIFFREFRFHINKGWNVGIFGVVEIWFDDWNKIVNDDVFPGILLKNFEQINSVVIYVLIFEDSGQKFFIIFNRIEGSG